VAEIVAVDWDETSFVLMLKVAEVSRASTQTFLGTVAYGLLLDRLILAPPGGAGSER
jgi:hypothetical protein